MYTEFSDTLWPQLAILNMCFPFNRAISFGLEQSTGKGGQRGNLAKKMHLS